MRRWISLQEAYDLVITIESMYHLWQFWQLMTWCWNGTKARAASMLPSGRINANFMNESLNFEFGVDILFQCHISGTHFWSLSWNSSTNTVIIPPASTKLKGGYTGITLSVCPSVRLSVCPSVDRIVSALYLQQYSSDPFHICTSYQATSEGVSRVMPVSKFKKFEILANFLNL